MTKLQSLLALAALVMTPELIGAGGERVVLPGNVVPSHYEVSAEPDIPGSTFKGNLKAQVKVVASTDRIVLNAAELVIDSASLSGHQAAPQIAYDPKVETATFTFSQPLAPGDYTLTLDYHGKINVHAAGLFGLDYNGASGKQRALFTQFENSDARRFLPCWDEPGIKASFQLTVSVPTELMAVSNTPIDSTQDLGGGLKRVRFKRTPPMSTYLLFFGLGDFERIHRDVGGVDVGVIVKRGETAKAKFALDAACTILPYYNDYFGTPYPLPKLDLIAGPGQSQFFSAMENWGAIFYFEKALLLDPRISTEIDRQRVYIVVAHEMAHQWFGDLVTMAWWDDLWLNEGFASWMQCKVTDHFHPEWKVWLQSQERRQSTMQVDAREGTHPIITPIEDVFQASNAFDGITYVKGQAVIRMLEAYVGADAFRAGVQHYIKDHAYHNTTTDDLWREVDAVSPIKLTQMAHDFTLQPGVPMITVAPAPGGLTLAEGRFALDESGKSGGSWQVPVMALSPAGKEPSAEVRTSVTAVKPTVLEDAVPGTVINAGQVGYFRTLYQGSAFAALRDRFGTLPADDQVGTLNDVSTLGSAGLEPMTDLLSLSQGLPVDADPIVWNQVVVRLLVLDSFYEGLPGQAAFHAFARKTLAPELQQVGWSANPGESQNTAILRSALLKALGRFDDAGVLAEARGRFAAYLKHPVELSPAARDTVFVIVATAASEGDWDNLHQLAKGATSWAERQQLYNFLGYARDPALAQKALDISLTEETEPTVRPAIVTAVAIDHPKLAFEFAAAHWEVFSHLLERTSLPRFVPGLASGSPDLAIIEPLEAFASAHIPPSAYEDVAVAEANIRYTARVRSERLPEVDRWFAGGPVSGGH